MIPEALRRELEEQIKEADHPREAVVDVMYALQKHYGYLTDEAVHEAASLVGMTPLEVDELATFYDFIYRERVGKYVIHACDGVVCWMFGEESVLHYLCRKLKVAVGETTHDGLFTVLHAVCIGYCDHAPAVLVNGRFYGDLNPERIDAMIEELRRAAVPLVANR
ncbi:MAG: NADH-quinone oxidoreductase subunit NuoE [Deltaproteobacteria bacterium]